MKQASCRQCRDLANTDLSTLDSVGPAPLHLKRADEGQAFPPLHLKRAAEGQAFAPLHLKRPAG